MLKHANMRKYRPCHALPIFFQNKLGFTSVIRPTTTTTTSTTTTIASTDFHCHCYSHDGSYDYSSYDDGNAESMKTRWWWGDNNDDIAPAAGEMVILYRYFWSWWRWRWLQWWLRWCWQRWWWEWWCSLILTVKMMTTRTMLRTVMSKPSGLLSALSFLA